MRHKSGGSKYLSVRVAYGRAVFALPPTILYNNLLYGEKCVNLLRQNEYWQAWSSWTPAKVKNKLTCEGFINNEDYGKEKRTANR